MPLDTPGLNGHSFSPEPPLLIFATGGGQLTAGPDHPPPWQPMIGGEDVADRPGCPGVAGAPGNLSVADDFSPTKVSNDDLDRLGESRFQLRSPPPY